MVSYSDTSATGMHDDKLKETETDERYTGTLWTIFATSLEIFQNKKFFLKKNTTPKYIIFHLSDWQKLKN